MTRLLRDIRYREVMILQGAPLMGLAFSVQVRGACDAIPALLLCAASILLVASIWQFNDWADLETDVSDRHRRPGPGGRTTPPAVMLANSIGLLTMSLALFAFLPAPTFLLAMIIALLGILYSAPGTRAKGVPIAGSILHLLGGSCHFLLATSVSLAIDYRTIAMSVFFALVFTAGHAMQEVQDHDADRIAGIRTNAVAFGRRKVFRAACVGFAVAYLDLFWLCLAGIASAPVGLVAGAVLPFQIAWSWNASMTRLGHDDVRLLRTRYRALFALIGLSMVVTAAAGALRSP